MSTTRVGHRDPDSDLSSRWPRVRIAAGADLLAAFSVLCLVAVLGLALGWLWSRLAPPELVSVLAGPAGQVLVEPMPGESEHRFEAMAIFVLLGMAAGALTGTTLWLLRRRRGPVVLVAAVLGSLLAAWLAMRVGLWLAEWRYPPADPQAGDIVARAPVLESGWVVIAQPFGVAVAYSLMVAGNGTEDLGRDAS